jgi:hypothetical protein
MRPLTQDMAPVAMKLFDLDNKQVGEVSLPPAIKGAELRTIVWRGRRFREGDGSGFYGPGEFAELP